MQMKQNQIIVDKKKGFGRSYGHPKVIILDDNELSILHYAEEFPENWKKICKALEERKNETKRKVKGGY